MNSIFPNRFVRLLRILLAVVTLGSCSGGSDSVASDSGDIYLRFLITTGRPAESRGVGEWTESEISVAERILNTDDIRFYLFDGYDNLVTEIIPSGLPWEAVGNDGIYTITASIKRSFMDGLVADGKFCFKLAVVANLQAVGSSYPQISAGTGYSSVDPDFTMPSDYYPSGTYGIPMFGVMEYALSRSALESATESAPYDITDGITMLRSLCKIELKDVMTNKFVADGVSYPKIDRVEMSEWNSDGYVRFASDNDGSYMTDGVVNSARIKTRQAETRKEFSIDGPGTYRIYIPEGSLSKSSVSVWVTRGPGEESTEFVYNLSEASAFGTSDLIRNHIYSLEVTKVGVTAAIRSGVRPWETVDISYDGSVSVSMAGYLAWSAGSDFSVIEGDGEGQIPELHFWNASEDYAEGIFEIATPADAVWTMQIVPGVNGVDAFEFVTVDESGGVISESAQSVSGRTGEISHIYVRAVGRAPSVDSHASLVLTVLDADGISYRAPIDIYDNYSFGLIRHRAMF